MAYVIIGILTLLMMFAGRVHGGDYFRFGRIASTLVLAADFALGGAALWGPWAALLGIISGLAFSTGHGNFYGMQGANPKGNGFERIETYFCKPIWHLFNGDIFKPAYSWFCMGTKWFLVALPIMPVGILVAIMAPAAYSYSFKNTGSQVRAEWITTILSGLLIAILCIVRFDSLKGLLTF